MVLKQLKISLLSILVWTVLLGAVYPLVVTAVARVFFSNAVNGSLIRSSDGKVLGSTLIGQPFDAPRYFWSRLSATSPFPYNASNSSGSNLGPTNPALVQEIQGRLDALHAVDPSNKNAVPIDLVTSSASGLDPHITPAAAEYQIERVARERHVTTQVIQRLIERSTDKSFLRFLGESGVNVLRLNLALDDISQKSHG